MRYGLTRLCLESIEGEQTCVTPELPQSWKATLVFVVFAVLTLTLACGLIAASFWKPKAFEFGKWVAVVACEFFFHSCLVVKKLAHLL